MQFKLFSGLDIQSILSLKLFIIIFYFLIFLKIYFFSINKKTFLLKFMKGGFSTLSSFSSGSYFKGQLKNYSSGFAFLLFLKLYGLLPYTMSVSSQFWMAFFFSLVFFLSFLFSSFTFDSISFISHFSPKSSPLWLIPLLNLMEMMSYFIRPFTLTLRLTMKISTGFILYTFLMVGLSSSFFLSNFIIFFFLNFIFFFFLMFETFVSFIQSFVFNLLLIQYKKDHP